ncbi:hypothetical protein HELRODRAFT_176107 [Helobdella robusta]|uniref:Uncharacterized protein n=1 Tax=Helobdella robusta TaxID=6412 RepID=T1FA49_HELRO|nr:hypothetical protein HELRODRAFT_176107 [Helobdella robusta]ESO00249.1 hypothetical protein HELRODRAFT_176107 [Helobdella robusta]
MGKQVLTVFSAYATQTGESEDDKNDFWNTLSDADKKTPSSEIPLIATLERKQMDSTVSIEALVTSIKTKTVSQHRLLVTDMNLMFREKFEELVSAQLDRLGKTKKKNNIKSK